jgi:hypothetical protein
MQHPVRDPSIYGALESVQGSKEIEGEPRFTIATTTHDPVEKPAIFSMRDGLTATGPVWHVRSVQLLFSSCCNKIQLYNYVFTLGFFF